MNFGDVGAIRHIIQNCRARDRAELEAFWGLRVTMDQAPQWANSAVLLKIFDAKEPVAFVAAHALTPRTVQMSMIATEDWPLVARQVVKWGKRTAMPQLLLAGFRRAECRSIEDHPEAIRFLTHLGFETEAYCRGYGRNGENFWQFAHVRRDEQRTKDVLDAKDQNAGFAFTAAA